MSVDHNFYLDHRVFLFCLLSLLFIVYIFVYIYQFVSKCQIKNIENQNKFLQIFIMISFKNKFILFSSLYTY